MPTFSSISSSLYRKGHERLPPLPSSIDEQKPIKAKHEAGDYTLQELYSAYSHQVSL